MKSETTDRHANARDRKRRKAKEWAPTQGRSVFLLQQINEAKAAEAQRSQEARCAEQGRREGRKR